MADVHGVDAKKSSRRVAGKGPGADAETGPAGDDAVGVGTFVVTRELLASAADECTVSP